VTDPRKKKVASEMPVHSGEAVHRWHVPPAGRRDGRRFGKHRRV